MLEHERPDVCQYVGLLPVHVDACAHKHVSANDPVLPQLTMAPFAA